MSAMRDEIVDYLNDYLEIKKFKDYCPNGMQVIGRPEVDRVALGVSANLECFRIAAESNAHMLIVHHGLFWENLPRTVGTMLKARLKMLFEYDITLVGYHLPLDAHAEVGNNALWLKQLGFTVDDNKLGFTGGQAIGAIGTTTKRQTLRDLVEQVNSLANATAHVYEYGPQTIRRMGVVTGGGQGFVMEAIACGCDTFLTGEVGEPTEAIAREEGINFIGIGHYNSEKIGILALSNLLETRFGVETFFCDVPNQI